MTATEDRLSLTPEFVAKHHLHGVGYGYALGRLAAGDWRIEGDADRFGDFYAAHHSRALDLDELYAEFVALREEQRAAEEERAS